MNETILCDIVKVEMIFNCKYKRVTFRFGNNSYEIKKQVIYVHRNIVCHSFVQSGTPFLYIFRLFLCQHSMQIIKQINEAQWIRKCAHWTSNWLFVWSSSKYTHTHLIYSRALRKNVPRAINFMQKHKITWILALINLFVNLVVILILCLRTKLRTWHIVYKLNEMILLSHGKCKSNAQRRFKSIGKHSRNEE